MTTHRNVDPPTPNRRRSAGSAAGWPLRNTRGTFAQINVRLEAELVNRVRDYCQEHNEPISVTVAAALGAYLLEARGRSPEHQRAVLARTEAELAAQLARYFVKLQRGRVFEGKRQESFFEGKWLNLLAPMQRAVETLRAGAASPVATALAVLGDAAFVDLACSLPENLGNARAGLPVERALGTLRLIVAFERRVVLYSSPT